MSSTDGKGPYATVSPPARGALRYEIKLVVQEAAHPWVRGRLLLDTAGFDVLYPPRRVQSVYFDSFDQQALEDNLAGISHREKIRFRWYGDASHGVHGQLERKVRHNQLGWKDVLPIDGPIDVEGVTRSEFARDVFARLTEEWSDVRAQHLLPVQWISYSREYYGSADGRLRVTFDRELQTYDQRSRFQLTNAFPTPTPRLLIVEVKCDEKHHDAARRLIDRFPLVVDKCSKFVLGSRPSEGPTSSIVL